AAGTHQTFPRALRRDTVARGAAERSCGTVLNLSSQAAKPRSLPAWRREGSGKGRRFQDRAGNLLDLSAAVAEGGSSIAGIARSRGLPQAVRRHSVNFSTVRLWKVLCVFVVNPLSTHSPQRHEDAKNSVT